MQQGGTIASIGLAASMSLNTTVAPFILRGVSLLGIDSGYIREPYRSGVWQRLASDLRPPHLENMARIAFDDLPAAFEAFIAGRAKGRAWLKLPEADVADLPRILIVDDSRVVRMSLSPAPERAVTRFAKKATARPPGSRWCSITRFGR
jgi:hypothetical protein